MSGHSKWSTIKRKKGANDAKRGALFTKLAREISMAARQGGDADMNFTLRLAIDKAKANNMPKDNIERAIKRGTGEDKDGAQFEEMLYEAYASNGIALMIQVTTDNRNRTLAEIKHALSKYGGNMAEPNSVSWQFEQKGYISLPAEDYDFDEIFLVAADAGAEDVEPGEDMIEVYTPKTVLQDVQEALVDSGYKLDEVRLDWVPENSIDLEADDAIKVMKVIELLEDLDDTQSVFSNLNISDDVMMTYEAVG